MIDPLSQSHNYDHDLGVNNIILTLCLNYIFMIIIQVTTLLRCELHDFDSMFQSHKNDHDGNYMILTLCFNHIIMIGCEIHDLSPVFQSYNHDLGVNHMILALCPNHIITIRCVLHDLTLCPNYSIIIMRPMMLYFGYKVLSCLSL